MDDLKGMLIPLAIFMLIAFIFSAIVFWKIFEKAGQPGWAALVPIYNNIVMLRIVGKPDWWIILALIPFLNLIFLFYMAIIYPFDLAKGFGKGGGFALGLIFLGIIFYPILAFGDAEYVGPEGRRRRGSSRRAVTRFDDEDDDDRPRRRRDEDEDDRPRRRRDEDEDEGDRPRRR